ncbi:MAG: sodium:solute symporter family transporter [Phycisphaerales bacterium]
MIPRPFSCPALASTGGFDALDWGVFAGYFALLIGAGVWFARRRVTSDRDYFLAGRTMPAWAVAVSLLGTAQSGATFIGGPQFSFASDYSYLITFAGGLLAAALVAAFFIPAYFRHGVWTPYELLERRFGRPARVAASVTYLVGRVFSNGSRVFIGSLAVSWVVFGDANAGHMFLAIGVLTIASILYALAGGIRSAIWIDAAQCAIYLGAAVVAIAYLLSVIPVGLPQVVATLMDPGPDQASKLTVVHTGLEWHSKYTVWTAATGFCLLFIAVYGIDQDFVQRTLTCRSAAQAGRSVMLGVLFQIPATLLFLAIGSLLWVYYQRPDLMGAAHRYNDDHTIFLEFILTRVPHGLAGLMIAGVFAAGLSTVNAMSSTFVNDGYKHLFPGRSERHYLSVGRRGVVAFGLLLGLFAAVCVFWYDPSDRTLLDFVLDVMSFAYAGLLGVFFTALFTRRGNSASAIAALLSGFLVVTILQPGVWTRLSGEPLGLAFPWQLVLGTMVATAVCCAGNPRASSPAEGAP